MDNLFEVCEECKRKLYACVCERCFHCERLFEVCYKAPCKWRRGGNFFERIDKEYVRLFRKPK